MKHLFLCCRFTSLSDSKPRELGRERDWYNSGTLVKGGRTTWQRKEVIKQLELLRADGWR